MPPSAGDHVQMAAGTGGARALNASATAQHAGGPLDAP